MVNSIAGSSELQDILSKHAQVMLKFSAEWCGPCQAVAPAIDKLAPQFPEVFLGDVDVDTNQDIAGTYSVSAIPTFVFLHKGSEVDRVKGADVAGVTAALRRLQARAPMVGPGQRVGSTSSDGRSTSSRGQPTLAEIRAARARALLPSADSQDKSADSVSGSAKNPAEGVSAPSAAKPRVARPYAWPSPLTLVKAFVRYFVLYIVTLFSLNARSSAEKLHF